MGAHARPPFLTAFTMFNIIYCIGILACLMKLGNILDFVWFYFLRPTNRWERYLQGPSPYALVTGATDGIGKATARELYDKGFNLILHGRNEKKLHDVIEEFQSAVSKKTKRVQEVRYFLEDASKAGINFEEIAQRFEGLNVTIFVNNVGTYTVRPERFGDLVSLSRCIVLIVRFVSCRFDEWTEEGHMNQIRTNSLFSLFLTRAFLPSLRTTARARPALVVFIGSFADETPMAKAVLYSATKHFDRRVALGLHTDERYDIPDDKAISFMYVLLGTVNSQLSREPPNFARPSSDLFAEKLVGTFGCGRQVVVPYVGHYVTGLVLKSLPEFLVAKELRESARTLVEKAVRESKLQ
jgi:17beta-estradiol 17-dehydrogenase / very-long-chain 3-oxoacyl-CoA reductase